MLLCSRLANVLHSAEKIWVLLQRAKKGFVSVHNVSWWNAKYLREHKSIDLFFLPSHYLFYQRLIGNCISQQCVLGQREIWRTLWWCKIVLLYKWTPNGNQDKKGVRAKTKCYGACPNDINPPPFTTKQAHNTWHQPSLEISGSDTRPWDNADVSRATLSFCFSDWGQDCTEICMRVTV